MCRILFLKGSNKKKALEFIDAFYNAGCNDPYLESVANLLNVPGIKNQHIHGWGFLLITSKGILNYRNGDFFYNDKNGFKYLKIAISDIDGDFVLMSELRITDEGYVSAFTSHPFPIFTKKGYDGWLFFNGLLDYKKLAKLENIDYSNYEKKNGTLILSHSIGKELDNGKNFPQAIQTPKIALKSGYNLMSFLHEPSGYKAYISSYVKEELLKTEIAYNYYKLLKKDYGDLFFAGSSAIGEYKKDDYTIMENGELLEFDINFIDEFYFNAYK